MNQENLFKILTLAVLASEGIKVARLAGNRDLKDKAIKAKMKSLKKCGMLVPAIIVDAKDAQDAGHEIVDCETGEAVTYENADQYVVLIDANHRYQAHLDLLKENEGLGEEERYKGDFYMMYPLSRMDIAAMLSEINTVTDPWKGGDYAKGASLINKGEKLPLLDFINELTTKGYSLEAASKWTTFTGKVNKTMMVKAMSGEISDTLRKTNGLERGERLLSAAREGFSEGFLKTRTLPDWIISKYDDADDADKATVISNIEAFFKEISRVDSDTIEQTKGKRGGDTKETIINRELNRLFEAKYKS